MRAKVCSLSRDERQHIRQKSFIFTWRCFGFGFLLTERDAHISKSIAHSAASLYWVQHSHVMRRPHQFKTCVESWLRDHGETNQGRIQHSFWPLSLNLFQRPQPWLSVSYWDYPLTHNVTCLNGRTWRKIRASDYKALVGERHWLSLSSAASFLLAHSENEGERRAWWVREHRADVRTDPVECMLSLALVRVREYRHGEG